MIATHTYKSMKEQLQELIKRRHPRYEELLPHWDFLEATYEGGRAWFKDNIFRYMKEGDVEYRDRLKRAYRFNHTKQVVDLVDKYLFKIPASRNEKDAPKEISKFWEHATMNGLDIDTFMRRISNASSRFGRIWIVVDSTLKTAGSVLTVADQEASGGRPYCYILRPQDMLDMSYDEAGELNWALVREIGRDDEDPMFSTGAAQIRYRLWTRDGWFLFEVKEQRGKPKVELIDTDNHFLGVVPIIQADHNFSEEPYESSGLIDDIAYLDRANANYLSNLDAIIQDQAFSQLTLPAQGMLSSETVDHTKLVEAGTKRIFTYNAEGGARPEFISPDPRQAGMILAAIGKIINEIYHSVGLAAERTKDDNGGGVDNASGVAKAYDFERVNSLLASKANTLQIVEDRINRMVALWSGVDMPDEVLAKYPEKFDTRSLYDEFEIGAKLNLLGAPDEMRRKQMIMVIDKLFPAASKEERAQLEKSLADWPPEELIEDGLGAAKPAGKKSGAQPIKAAGTQKAAKELAA
jgi:hypothetical protein